MTARWRQRFPEVTDDQILQWRDDFDTHFTPGDGKLAYDVIRKAIPSEPCNAAANLTTWLKAILDLDFVPEEKSRHYYLPGYIRRPDPGEGSVISDKPGERMTTQEWVR